MESEILEKIKEQDVKLNEILRLVEKTRKYIFWRTVATVVFFLLPLIGLAFIIPWFLDIIKSTYGELGV